MYHSAQSRSIRIADQDVSVETTGGRIAFVEVNLPQPMSGDCLLLLDMTHYTIAYNTNRTQDILYPGDKHDIAALERTLQQVMWTNGKQD